MGTGGQGLSVLHELAAMVDAVNGLNPTTSVPLLPRFNEADAAVSRVEGRGCGRN